MGQEEWISRIDQHAAETAQYLGNNKSLSFQNFSEDRATSFARVRLQYGTRELKFVKACLSILDNPLTYAYTFEYTI